jgi:hypothetical protein
MRIEIDTKHDTKEELEHLGNMLLALSGKSGAKVYEKPKDMFSDDSPGMFNMFSDSSPKEPETPAMFNMFDDSEPEPKESKDVVDDIQIVPY